MDLLKAEIEKKRKQLEDANLVVSNYLYNMKYLIYKCYTEVISYVIHILCRTLIENTLKEQTYCLKNEKSI